jgi:hypothetical protein
LRFSFPFNPGTKGGLVGMALENSKETAVS